MKHEEQIFLEGKYEALAETGHLHEAPALYGGQWRSHRAQNERAREAHLPERLSREEALEMLRIDGDVRQLRHPMGE